MAPCKIIGISGGSGSGKSTLAKKFMDFFSALNPQIISQDNYYFDQSHKFDKDGGSVNFDHPSAIEFNLLIKNIQELKAGKPAYLPSYDFKTHSRSPQTITVNPSALIILDGTMIFHPEKLREIIDFKIFLQVDESLRFERRLKRDVSERGRTPEGVKDQFFAQVKPMHDQFVEPSKNFANFVIIDNQNEDASLQMVRELL